MSISSSTALIPLPTYPQNQDGSLTASHEQLPISSALASIRSIQLTGAGKTLNEAVETNDIEALKALLSSGQNTPEALGEALVVATRKDHLEIAKQLLVFKGIISQEHRSKALYNLAFHGHIDEVKQLLSSGEISQENRGEALTVAAQNGHLEIFRALFFGEISQKDRGEALRLAALNGHLEIFCALFFVETISEEDLGLALVNATGKDHLEIAKQLLVFASRISKEHLGLALVNLAFDGHIDEVKQLLVFGSRISKEHLGKAFIVAAQNGHLEIFGALFSIETISEEDLGTALVNATGKDHLEIAKQLLVFASRMSKEDRGLALVNLAFDGHIDEVKQLLSSGEISQEHLGKAFIVAAQNGHLEIFRSLFFVETISEEDLGTALVSSTSENHLEIAKQLLVFASRMSKEDRGLVLVNLAIDGHLDEVKQLLSSGEISQEHLGKAFIAVAQNGHLEIFRSLFFIETLSEEDLGTALVNATNKDHLEIAKQLLVFASRMSKEHRGSALVNLAHDGHIDEVKQLLSSGDISQEDQSKAVAVAGGNGHLEVIQEIYSKGGIIFEEYSDMALESAAINGHLSVVKFLMAQYSLSTGQIERLIPEILPTEHKDILEFFLTQGSIGNTTRNLVRNHIEKNEDPSSAFRTKILKILDSQSVSSSESKGPGVAAHHFDDQIYTTLEDIENHPLSFLDLVCRSFPKKIVLIDSLIANDMGGITKQCITTFIDALIKKRVILRNNQCLPIANSEDMLPVMHKMGMFFSSLFARNKYRFNKFLIGNLFHPRFFDLVKIALQEGSREFKLIQVADFIIEIEPLIHSYKLAKKALQEQTLANLQAYQKELGGDKQLSPEEPFECYLQAAQAFANGLSGEFKDKLLTTDSSDLMIYMQGEAISADKVKAICYFQDDTPEFLEKIDWIMEKIAEADISWVEQFVFAITGNRILSTDLKIEINPSSDEIFDIRTCVSTIKIPTQIKDKEIFLMALETIIKENSFNAM